VIEAGHFLKPVRETTGHQYFLVYQVFTKKRNSVGARRIALPVRDIWGNDDSETLQSRFAVHGGIRIAGRYGRAGSGPPC
jgi:hypothetical protein